MTPVLSKPTDADADELARGIRAFDAEEVARFDGSTPLVHVRRAIAGSAASFSLRTEPEGPLLAIFGARFDSLLSDAATMWLLTTREVDRRPLSFLRCCRACLDAAFAAVPAASSFANVVPANHSRTLEWLRWMGASEFEAITLGGTRAVPVTIRREPWAQQPCRSS